MQIWLASASHIKQRNGNPRRAGAPARGADRLSEAKAMSDADGRAVMIHPGFRATERKRS